jgi:poly(A) polymerase
MHNIRNEHENMERMKAFLHDPIFRIIAGISDDLGQASYVIGGYVRDKLLHRISPDIDIVTVGSGIELARRVARAIHPRPRVTVFKNFGTAMLHYQKVDIEFVGARKESYQRHSRKPFVENGTLSDDQRRRDFTINALALSLNKETYGELMDPFEGVEDLRKKLIRTPLDPEITFSDDPLRMMRAIRFSTQLNFTIESQTLEAITTNRERIKIVSAERITEELNKIILARKPSKGFRLLDKTGLLEFIVPELHNMKGRDSVHSITHKDNFLHTLKVLDRLAPHTDNLWLRWSALLHDIAKPQTKRFVEGLGWTFYSHNFIGAKMVPRIFRRLKLPLNDKMKYVQKMVLLHMRPIVLSEDTVTDSAVRRLLFEAGEDIDDLMTLCEADITSGNEKKVERYLQNFGEVRKKLKEIEEKDHIRNFQPPVSGELIMETFNLPPSKEVGVIKNAIKEAILEGEIRNDFKEAYQFMLRKANQMGLKKNKKPNEKRDRGKRADDR